ncbi:cupin domain-containing protein [Microbacterium sp. 2P01SA-2]|uniref:cupin domain-containing protein n=1 Tax=unclassified Microbacterium TaxID=2609290 RepID=UPI00399F32A2
MTTSSFPGGTSLSHLDIYDDVTVDGACGGSPHMHLVSTEAYLVVGGRGALQTIDRDGFRETPLEPGSVVWFTPGTIHRAVNTGGLRVFVLMSNAGLPEAGDAVMTFPAEVVGDPAAYGEAASLGRGDGPAARAARRRDLAVTGFERLRAAAVAGDMAPLHEFYELAGALVRSRAAGWGSIVREGALAEAERSLTLTEATARGELTHLRDGRVHVAPAASGERAFGMCGRIRAYDVTDQENPR